MLTAGVYSRLKGLRVIENCPASSALHFTREYWNYSHGVWLLNSGPHAYVENPSPLSLLPSLGCFLCYVSSSSITKALGEFFLPILSVHGIITFYSKIKKIKTTEEKTNPHNFNEDANTKKLR